MLQRVYGWRSAHDKLLASGNAISVANQQHEIRRSEVHLEQLHVGQLHRSATPMATDALQLNSNCYCQTNPYSFLVIEINRDRLANLFVRSVIIKIEGLNF